MVLLSTLLSGVQGIQGTQGPQGLEGSQGLTGTAGIPSAGTAGQVLVKNSSTNFDTEWVTIQGFKEIEVTSIGNAISIENVLSNYTKEPTGFENRTDSTITFNNTTRQLSISPVSVNFKVWVVGELFIKTGTETITIPNTTGIYYIYYDNTGTLQYKTSFFTLSAEAPIAYIYWNSTDSVNYYFGEERHGITLDWATHEYLHRTRGAAFATGFSVSNYVVGGNGSLDSHAQLDIAGGTFYDEDIPVVISHSNTPVANTWEQDLVGPARIPVIYRVNGAWVRDAATDYPLKSGIARPTYNLNTAGTWSTPDVTNNQYVAYFIVATHSLGNPIISIMGQREDVSLGNANTNNTWSTLDLAGFPSLEFRPLWRIIFQVGNAFGNTVKATVAQIDDLRADSSVLGSTAGAQGIQGIQGISGGGGGTSGLVYALIFG
jgi:hypothetical protein